MSSPDLAQRKELTIDILSGVVDRFPSFRPHSLLQNGHLQTLAGTLLGGGRLPYRATSHAVLLPDGDTSILHDDRPAGWQPDSPAAILVHGLTGSHQSAYMVHAARRLNEAGVRTFRMDLRACGAGEGLSRMPYEPGCSQDLRLALQRVVELCPASSIGMVGFSIGGNTVLKLTGEAAGQLPPQLNRLVVICPPIDLQACSRGLSKGAARFYDRFLALANYRQLFRSQSLVERAPHVVGWSLPHRQRDFDEKYTAPAWGFGTADEFYVANSSFRTISSIRIPTLLIASRDDPLVPIELFEALKPTPAITLHLTHHGGHLGFIGRQGTDPDRRWLDWRIVDYIASRHQELSPSAAA